MASSSYAAPSDVFGTAGYLRDPNSTANNAIMTTLLAVASRFLDEMCGQFFYDDGFYQQPIDGVGSGFIEPRYPFFFSSGTIGAVGVNATSLTYTTSKLAPAVPQNGDSLTLDTGNLRETVTINGAVTGSGPYTLPITATANAHVASTLATTLQVEIAYFENQPLANRIVTLDGDAVTPPTNMYAWPRMRPRVGAANQSTADNTNRWPWKAIDISHIPISNTTYLPTTIYGYATVRVGAHWGWPVVPDLIKDLTCKYAARLWNMRQAGERGQGGAAEIGVGSVRELFDAHDEAVLLASGLKAVYV